MLASKDEATARQLSILAGLLCALAAVPPALLGILACGADWSARGLASPDATLILPYVLKNLTPPFVAAIGLGAVSAAVMSSIDSSVLSASSMAAWNVYRPLVEPDACSARLTWVVKRAVIVVGTAATLMALHVRSIYTLWVLCSDLVYCILFPQLLLALKDRRANRWGSVRGDGRVFCRAHRRGRAVARIADAVSAPGGRLRRDDGPDQDHRDARGPSDDVDRVARDGGPLRARGVDHPVGLGTCLLRRAERVCSVGRNVSAKPPRSAPRLSVTSQAQARLSRLADVEARDQTILILKIWPTIWSTNTAPWRSRTTWWTSTMVLAIRAGRKGGRLHVRVDDCPLSGPIAAHGLTAMNVAALHAIGPRDIGVQCREHGLDVPGIEALIDLAEKFHVDGHWKL